MVNLYDIKVNTADVTAGQSIAAYLTDAAGALITSTLVGAAQRADVNTPSEHVDGSAYAAGTDYLMSAGAVDESGNWQPLNIDATGALLVAATVTIGDNHAEDSAHTSGDIGSFSLLVRQDTLATSTSADGDYGAFKSNAAGSLYVHDTASLAQLVLIKGDTASIATSTSTTATNTGTIASTLTALSKAEDAAHASGDQGIQALAVRNDTPGSLAGTNGDYAPLQVDATGNLRVTGSVTVAGQYAEDSAAASGDIGIFSLGVRRDTTGTSTSASGDYSEIQTWSNGELKVVDIANSTILQQQVAVTSTAAQVPAANLANRKTLMLQNTGTQKKWIGSATVTTSGATAGIEMPGNSFMELECGPAVAVFAVKTGGGSDTLNVLELS